VADLLSGRGGLRNRPSSAVVVKSPARTGGAESMVRPDVT
jgi:hypothetical protein